MYITIGIANSVNCQTITFICTLNMNPLAYFYLTCKTFATIYPLPFIYFKFMFSKLLSNNVNRKCVTFRCPPKLLNNHL